MSSSTKSEINHQYLHIHSSSHPFFSATVYFLLFLPLQTTPLSMGLRLVVGHCFNASICSCSAMQRSIECLPLLSQPQIIGQKIVFKEESLNVRGNNALKVNFIICHFTIPNLIRFFFFLIVEDNTESHYHHQIPVKLILCVGFKPFLTIHWQ